MLKISTILSAGLECWLTNTLNPIACPQNHSGHVDEVCMQQARLFCYQIPVPKLSILPYHMNDKKGTEQIPSLTL